jgi:hypothetical protein
MPQPKALKSPYGQGPDQLEKNKAAEVAQDEEFDFSNIARKVDLSANAEEPSIPSAATAPSTGQQQFVGPYSPEFYQGQDVSQPMVAEQPVQQQVPQQGSFFRGYTKFDEKKAMDQLIDSGELGAGIALGVAFPQMGLLGLATTSGALNFVKNTLKNQYRPENEEFGNPQKFFNATMSGLLTGGVGAGIKGLGWAGGKALETKAGRAAVDWAGNTKAARWFLDKLIQDASKSGDDAIASHAKSLYDDLGSKGDLTYDAGIAAKAAEAEAAKKAGVQLSAGEAFYFDPEARRVTEDVLAQNPNIALGFAERLGNYAKGIRRLFGKEDVPAEGGILGFVVNQIDNYGTEIGQINKQLMASGASHPETRLAGEELLSLVDNTLKKYSKNLDDDILSRQAPLLWNLRKRIADKIKLADAEEFVGGKAGAIVDQFGKPIPKEKAAAQLALSDIQTFLQEVGGIARKGFEAEKKNIPVTSLNDVSYGAAMELYGKGAAIRDRMSESIANRIGRPELAARVSQLRKTFSDQIDTWRQVQKELGDAPADEIKYLFTKGDAKTAKQVMSVLPNEMKTEVRRKFIGRMIDPIYLAEAGEVQAVKALEGIAGGKAAFATARNQWNTYDRAVKEAIYSADEIKAIDTFLSLGQRAEQLLSTPGVSEKAVNGAVKSMSRIASNPTSAGTIRELISLLPVRSPLRNRFAAVDYAAEKFAAGQISKEAARAAGVRGLTGSQGLKRLSTISPKEISPVASRTAGSMVTGPTPTPEPTE